MEPLPVSRRLAAILAADVVSYSRLMAEDEEGTLRTLLAYRATISDLVAEHSGRIFGTAGDSIIVEFASAVQAVRAAVAIQRALHRRNADLPQARRMDFRIGINSGDVVAEGDDLLGDGVNVAARLQASASPAGICISGAVRDQIAGKLDFPLASLGELRLKNIPRPVAAHRVDWTVAAPAAAGHPGAEPALPDKPSIAVLPLVNMGGDPEQEYFADGVTEDIITALSRYRWFFVVARNSTFAYKGRSVDIKQVGCDLGVRYVLEGSVRKAGNRIRVTAQLIEAATGNHLWAERFDRDLADVFALQDEIAQSVVAAIEPELLLEEGRRATRKGTAHPDAFDCCLRGIWHLHQFTEDDNRRAEALFRRAAGLDPSLAQAQAGLARCLNIRIWWGWSRDIAQEMADECAAATRAVALDDRDPYAQYAVFWASLLMHRHEQALGEAQRSIDLNPNFALGYLALGVVRVFIGRPAEALDALSRYQRLCPNDPQAEVHHGWVALALYHQGKYEEAVVFAERSVRGRRHSYHLRTLLATLGQLGRTEDAEAVLAEMERLKPPDERYWEITFPYAGPADRGHLDEGLRKAGMKV